MLRIACAALLISTATASPLRILAVGDSLTEEYRFEFPFAAPDSEPTESKALNWPELLRFRRPTEASLGPYNNNFGSYPDLRDGGHEWNFGVPGYTTLDWRNVLLQDSYNPAEDNAQEFLWWRTHEALEEEIFAVQIAVIFLGGNDLKQDYDEIFTGTKPQSFYDGIVNRIGQVRTFIRLRRPNLPIVVCTIPDVSATPQIANTFNEPTMAAAARTRIAALNQNIIDTFGSANGTAVARIDRITDKVHDDSPFSINGVEFTIPGDPENPPTHVFCKDDFHPNTVGQALIANEIFAAINQLLPDSITPFPDREVLLASMIDPDQPYFDFIDGFAVAEDGPDDDPDGDRLPNLVEMGLGTHPGVFSTSGSGTYDPDSPFTWTPEPSAADYLNLFAEESGSLSGWQPVPAGRISENDGSLSISPPPGAPHHFIRLKAVPRP